jgi:hypothetical protein
VANYPKKRQKAFDTPAHALSRSCKLALIKKVFALRRFKINHKFFGVLTPKCVDVYRGLIWGHHNATTGKCFPSYLRIAKTAKCALSEVRNHIADLEAAGLIKVFNRLRRVKQWDADRELWVTRVVRTSNAYLFMLPADVVQESCPQPSKAENQPGTQKQVLENSLKESLDRLLDGLKKHVAAQTSPPRLFSG